LYDHVYIQFGYSLPIWVKVAVVVDDVVVVIIIIVDVGVRVVSHEMSEIDKRIMNTIMGINKLLSQFSLKANYL